MKSITEKMPNSEYYVAIDERGIIIEGQVDPLYICNNLKELFFIWNFDNDKIDEYFKNSWIALEKAQEITQGYIENYGMTLTKIDVLDKMIAHAIVEGIK